MKRKAISILQFIVLSLFAVTAISAQKAAPQKPTVGIFVFDGAQVIDYAGPYEVFINAGFKVVTIAPKKEMITSIGNLRVMPDFDFSDAPKLDILLIPGGGKHGLAADLEGVWKDAPLPVKPTTEIIDWVKKKSEEARYVLSVCNGAFVLARAGLLDGKAAVTTMPFLYRLKEVSPTTTVAFDKRWTDNGKILSSGGLSSGIDAALHVVAKMKGEDDASKGKGSAQMLALGLEYRWDPEGNYSAFSLAQKYMMFGFDIEGESLSRAGDDTYWENKWLVTRPATSTEVLAIANKSLSEQTTYGPVKIKWVRDTSSKANKDQTSLWNFTDEKGQSWVGFASVEPLQNENGKLVLSVKVARKDSAYAKNLR